MNYAKQLLQSALNSEIRAKVSAQELTAGNGFRFNQATHEAFGESLRLAEERIPQLDEAIRAIEFMQEENEKELRNKRI